MPSLETGFEPGNPSIVLAIFPDGYADVYLDGVPQNQWGRQDQVSVRMGHTSRTGLTGEYRISSDQAWLEELSTDKHKMRRWFDSAWECYFDVDSRVLVFRELTSDGQPKGVVALCNADSGTINTPSISYLLKQRDLKEMWFTDAFGRQDHLHVVRDYSGRYRVNLGSLVETPYATRLLETGDAALQLNQSEPGKCLFETLGIRFFTTHHPHESRVVWAVVDSSFRCIWQSSTLASNLPYGWNWEPTAGYHWKWLDDDSHSSGPTFRAVKCAEFSGEFIEYEDVFAVGTYPDEVGRQLDVGLLRKAEAINWTKEDRRTRRLTPKAMLESIADAGLSLTVKDSEEAGNCHVGTTRFLQKFNLPEEILASRLSSHKKLDMMLNNSQFVRVIRTVYLRLIDRRKVNAEDDLRSQIKFEWAPKPPSLRRKGANRRSRYRKGTRL
jgi:hypothetical protein